MTDPARLTRPEAQALAREVLAEHRPGFSYGLGCLKNLDRPMRAQVFCAAHPREHLVVKVFAPAFAEKARAQSLRQHAVATQMSDGPWRAPEVLFFDELRLVLGMAYAPGPSLAELWPQLPAEKRDATLEAAGSWLAALHRPTLEPGKLRPRGQLDWLARLLQRAREGGNGLPDVEKFSRALSDLETLFPEIRSLPATRAVTHRDLHLANLVSAEGALWGLDFENDAPDAPYRDLVALLIDALASAPEPDAPRFAAALARGYRDDITAPAARLFAQRAYALGTWARTPAEPSLRQGARLAAAKMILAADKPLF
ncbi:aminoglycoside phosphotransferase family protein [Yangia mangrovi]|uniref:Phosphotransferase n=1 Tax=Alloyangia mangrovi TaxID=1779329 RepID=A0A2A3JU52_9RHOB|nr:aminoglycoside phosphotransferase family protein [Alloyangia mangrovi]MCT4369625.1 aminoglycoside phosphotransferase family protein [Alloyangia mangrovi]